MAVPLIVLAVLSAVGGFVGVPASLGGSNAIEQWLDPVFERAQEKMIVTLHGVETTEYVLMALSLGVALAGLFVARDWYLRRKDVPDRLAERVPAGYKLLLNKYYVDEAYDAMVVNPTVKGSERLLWKIFDVGIIDWLVNAIARAVAWASATIRLAQTGVAQSYVFVFLLGVIAILGWLLMRLS
jgi:NADH-quinone oxidoreductase subunit L